MKPKARPSWQQGHLVYKDLLQQLNPKDPLLQLAERIPWSMIEADLAKYYAERGRPAKNIRLMVGLLILKQLENLSDERVVQEWVRNPYYQAFCGEQYFQWKLPCEPSDLTHFRNRIKENGVEKIFQASILIHGDTALEDDVVVDTTVQPKNITYPTDVKLRLKVIEKCLKLARSEVITLRQSYTRTIKKLKRIVRFEKSSSVETIEDAKDKIKYIANSLLKEIEKKLQLSVLPLYQKDIEVWRKAVNQEREDKNKVYSLHERDVVCINKGKKPQKFEFGSIVAIAMTKTSGVIVGLANYSKNIYDGHTLRDVTEHIVKMRGKACKRAICDRGFRGNKINGDIEVSIPDTPRCDATYYEKTQKRKDFGRRCAIEPVIGHIKNDFRMANNYLKGVTGDVINMFMSAAAFNFKKWMRVLKS